MTEKRFTRKDESIINIQTDELVNASSEESAKIIVSWLNELSDKKAELMKENYGLLDGLAYREEVEIPKLSERISDLECENEQLKQRNDRQAKQLDRLYRLIEEKDWRTLNDILDDFRQCEEQLQKEWGTYGDFE